MQYIVFQAHDRLPPHAHRNDLLGVAGSVCGCWSDTWIHRFWRPRIDNCVSATVPYERNIIHIQSFHINNKVRLKLESWSDDDKMF